MAENDANRPTGRQPPRDRPKSPYYKASLVLAFVFLALALSLPFWLDRVRQPLDRGVLDRDFQSVTGAPVPSLSAVTAAAGIASGGRPGTPAPSGVTNADCRAYVFAQCNALRVPPAACLPIALDGVNVPIETGLEACREMVDILLKAAARSAGANVETEPSGGVAPVSPDPRAAAASPGQPAQDETKSAPAPQTVAAAVAAAAAEAAGAAKKLPPPEVQAEKLAKVLKVLDELQRGANNYATLPAAQSARLAEIRGLVEEVGTEDAKKMYNKLREKYVAPPPPPPGAAVAESQRVEAGGAGNGAPPPSPEVERVRALMNDARKQAGMAPVAAPDPNEALRSHTPNEAAASPSIEQRP